MTTIICSRKQIKKRARKILFSDYQTFLFATLFFTAVSFGFTMLSKTFCELLCTGVSDDIYATLSLTVDIAAFIVSFPFMLGFVSLCTNITYGKKTELSHLFSFYSVAGRLRNCYAFLLMKIPEALLKLVFPYIALFFARGIVENYIVSDEYDIYIGALFFLLLIAVTIGVFYLSCGLLIAVIDFCLGTKRKYKKSEKRSLFTARLSLIPLYILSVLTFGVLFTAYTLPFTLIVYTLCIAERKEYTHTEIPDIYNDNFGDTAIFTNVRTDIAADNTNIQKENN